MEKQEIKVAIDLMKKKVKEYNEAGKSAYYEESYFLSEGKAVGMEEALDILRKSMKKE